MCIYYCRGRTRAIQFPYYLTLIKAHFPGASTSDEVSSAQFLCQEADNLTSNTSYTEEEYNTESRALLFERYSIVKQEK